VTGIETLHESSGTLHWSVAFKDLASPALVVFADPYGRGGGQGGGFVLRPAYGRSKKAFTATQGSTLSTLLSKIVSSAPSVRARPTSGFASEFVELSKVHTGEQYKGR
jgi:hypothetical protein